MFELYTKVSQKTSKMVTQTYSTSFSLGIKLLSNKFHDPIYGIYGFVRFADEIVDSFHDFDKVNLLANFKKDTYVAIEQGISLNPILHSFQLTVNKYNIDHELIETFLKSMEMDLNKSSYNQEGYKEYIVGSAEVVGLMCLKVFCEGNLEKYNELKPFAMSLGSAFQKINFLRDLNEDYWNLGRIYFPGIEINNFDELTKQQLVNDIEKDFKMGYEGIKRLPESSRFGVYVAYVYYFALLNKIKTTAANKILNERVRIPNNKKYALLLSSYIRHSFNMF
jgi:phytoene synthase